MTTLYNDFIILFYFISFFPSSVLPFLPLLGSLFMQKTECQIAKLKFCQLPKFRIPSKKVPFCPCFGQPITLYIDTIVAVETFRQSNIWLSLLLLYIIANRIFVPFCKQIIQTYRCLQHSGVGSYARLTSWT